MGEGNQRQVVVNDLLNLMRQRSALLDVGRGKCLGQQLIHTVALVAEDVACSAFLQRPVGALEELRQADDLVETDKSKKEAAHKPEALKKNGK